MEYKKKTKNDEGINELAFYRLLHLYTNDIEKSEYLYYEFWYELSKDISDLIKVREVNNKIIFYGKLIPKLWKRI